VSGKAKRLRRGGADKAAVIPRSMRGIQYAGSRFEISLYLEYWITRFAGG